MSDTDFVAVCHDLAQRGLALLLQSGLLLALGLGLAASLRRHGPHVQSFVCRATLLAVVMTGMASFLLAPYTHSFWRITLPGPLGPPQAVAVVVEQAAPSPRSAPDAFLPPPVSHSFPTSPSDVPPPVLSKPIEVTDALTPPAPQMPPHSPFVTLYVLSVAVWAIGTALLLFWLVVGQVSLFVLRRRSVPLATGPAAELMHRLCRERPLPLLLSARVRSPFLGGFWRPAVFLPTSHATEFDGPALHAILAHELAHRDRNDNRWMLLTRLLCALFWPQPLCWILARHMEQASEEACDTIVLASGCPPRVYADCLLSLAQRFTPSHPERTFGAGVVPFRSAIGRRVQRILHKGSPIMPTLSPRLRLVVTLSILFSSLSAALFVSGSATSAQQTGSVPPPPDQAATECAAHLQAITQAVTQYAQDHQGHLPNGRTWADEIMPYVKDPSVFHDPGTPPTQRWSYAYNQNLSGALLDQIPSPSQTVVVYDSESDFLFAPVAGFRNASNPGDALPRPSRHQGFNLFGFLDGHTQSLPSGQKPPFKVTSTRPAVAGKMRFRSDPDTLSQQTEKAKQDWLSFQQAHPVTLSKTQRTQIKHLIDLRLERNEEDDQIRMNAVYRAKHLARLGVLQPGQKVERRKWEAQIKVLDAKTLQWQAEMPKIEQEIIRQEALVQTFSDDYLETLYKRQQYSIFLDVQRVNAMTRIKRKVSLPTHLPDSRADPAASGPRRTEPGTSFFAGLTAVQGPGVVVTLNDGHQRSSRTSSAAIMPFLIHDQDINQIINDLRWAGAEAIAVNDQRLVATSAIRAAGQTLMVNNTPLPQPYVLRAIGNPQLLTDALSRRGGIKDELQQVDATMIQIKSVQRMVLPAYSGSTEDRYATPVQDDNHETLIRLTVRDAQRRALRHVQTMLHEQILDTQRKLDLSQQGIDSQGALLKILPVPHYSGAATPVQEKKAYVRAVHEHNQQESQYWSAIADRSRLREEMRRLQAVLNAVDGQIGRLR